MAPSFLTEKELTEIFTYLGEYFSYLKDRDWKSLSKKEKEIFTRLRIISERS